MKIHNYISITVILALFIILACNGPSKDEEEIQTDSILSIDTAMKKYSKYPIPTPIEVTRMLNKAGASYNPKFSNSTKNLEKYFTENSRALNLGVYGTDLSYAACFKKSQETMDFYKCAKKLQDDIDIQAPNYEDIAGRIENNLENQDSLYDILTNSFKSTFNYLNDNGKGAISALILSGGWIEGLYISCRLAENSTNQTEIFSAIARQKASIEILTKLLEDYKNNQRVTEISAELMKIKMLFDKLETVDKEVLLKKEDFEIIKAEIVKLRKNVVETY